MARKQIFAMTADDREFIQELAREVFAMIRNQSSRSHELEDYPSGRACYVALIPPGGIPSIVTETGTGSGVGGDTGTGSDTAYMPGSASCQIYRLLTVPPRNVEELVYAGFSETVHSLSRIGHEGSVFAKIHRDNWGTWWVDEPGLPYGSC